MYSIWQIRAWGVTLNLRFVPENHRTKFSVRHLTRKLFENIDTEGDSIFIGLIRCVLLSSVCPVERIVKTENLHGNLSFKSAGMRSSQHTFYVVKRCDRNLVIGSLCLNEACTCPVCLLVSKDPLNKPVGDKSTPARHLPEEKQSNKICQRGSA